ncbi:MAG TPA: hypothetical protein PKA61_05485 [Nitrospira sp.]|nr:hypothetical protein [Nitrospira sp.]
MTLGRCGRYFAIAVLGAATVMGAQTASAASKDLNGPGTPVLWIGEQKSTTWVEELIGQVLTYQTLAEKQVIEGNFQPYLDQMIKVRNNYRTGDRRATYDGVNQFMTMLEVRVGGVDAHSAEALWNFCYRVTPDEYHARDRHVRAKGEAEVNKEEEFLRDMEERASLSF